MTACALGPVEKNLSPEARCFFVEQARSFVREKGLLETVAQFMAAIGYLESRFGYTTAWLTDAGEPSWNWGAIISLGTQESVTIPGAPKMRAYPSTEAAQKSFWATWAKPDTLDRAKAGDTLGVSEAMGNHGYYGSVPPLEYARTIQGAARTLFGDKTQIRLVEPSTSSIWKPLLLSGAAALGLWFLSKRVK